CATAALLSDTAARSSTTGRPTKKPAELRIHASISASQSATGGSGARAKAMYERPRKRMEPRERATLVTMFPTAGLRVGRCFMESFSGQSANADDRWGDGGGH